MARFAVRAMVGASLAIGALALASIAPTASAQVFRGDVVPTSSAVTYTYPSAWRGPVVDRYFGVPVADPYRWLEDSSSSRTQRWVKQESDLARTYLDSLPTLRSRTTQMTGLLNYERVGTPVSRGPLRFWTYNSGLLAQAVIQVSDSDGSNPRVLVDPNGLSLDGTVSVPQWSPSWDGANLAWAASVSGSDWRTIRFTDVASGEVLTDVLEGARFTSLEWAPDNSGLYYSRYPQSTNPLQQAATNQAVYFHRLGTAQSDDIKILDDPSKPERRFWPIVTPDTKRLWIVTIETDRKEGLLFKNLTDPLSAVTQVVAPLGDINVLSDSSAGPTIYSDYLAPNGRIVRVNLASPSPVDWSTVVPEGTSPILNYATVGNSIVVMTLKNAISQVDMFDAQGGNRRAVRLPGLGSVSSMTDASDSGPAYLTYSSFTTAPEVLELDDTSGEVSTWRTSAAASTASPRIVTSQEWVRSKDGTRVPVFVVRRSDTRRDGTNPTLLYGYGGFNISITPDYQPFVLGWVQRGGIYVSANLRGGGEYGRDWHRAGTLQSKQNVFDDYIATAEWLVAKKWTKPSHLAITGRSNGGLLVGAAMTQRPELFGAAIPIVGVMDMLRYHRFTIGASWASDYGRSDDSAAMFRYLLGYSPVQNLRPGTSYPATMVMTADTDDRVVPAHSYKFAATLQHDNANTRPMLIRITMGAGHGGGSSGGGSVQQDISASADRLAFLDAQIGGRGPVPTPTFTKH